mmetsp:Transcript_63589/g.131705  ORF Transcript_63589/g.131705 Transcript_63589/m.131705 type:complete len:864 (+) Transcript_63589:81-2672(+)
MAGRDEYDPWFDQITLGIREEPAEAGKVIIRNVDGTSVDVDSLQVSDAMKDLLKVVDADDDGIVDDVNARDALRILSSMKAVFGSHGHMSHAEAEKGLGLLQKLVKEKEANSHEVSYTHMPACVQDVMKEWDLDLSGSVSVVELSAAASAHKKVKEEGRIMKRIILGLAAVILLLLTGTFILSYLAVDMSKEMRGQSDGVMKNNDGETVKVDSSSFQVQADGTVVTRGSVTPSCPANTTCRRLESSSPILQVAQSKQGKVLTSTLPDYVFKNLDMVTVSAEPHFVQLKVVSMKRLQMRSSKCGSVVQLHTEGGVLTIDDTTMSADEQLTEYVDEVLGHLLEEQGPLGRRLQQGFLEGFFTLLEDVEWECTSVPLPNPEDIPLNYHAKMHVKELLKKPEVSNDEFYSLFAKESFGIKTPFLKAGVSHNASSGAYYFEWDEDVLVFPGLRVAAKTFDMHPLQRKLDITSGAARAFVDAMDGTGHHCMLSAEDVSLSLGKLVSQATGLRLVVLKQEKGKVLRQWRMDVGGAMNDPMSTWLGKYGLVDNITLDYFDVDTDPSGSFQAGQPYRIEARSTAGDYHVVVQYLSLTPVDVMDVEGALQAFNVNQLSAACEVDPIVAEMSGTANQALIQEIEKLPVVASPKVPRSDHNEWAGNVKFYSQKMIELAAAGKLDENDLSPYWKAIVSNSHIQNYLGEMQSEITDGPSEYQLCSERTGGLSVTFEVEYSNSTNSILGGIESLKAKGVGSVTLPAQNLAGNSIDISVEISAASKVGPYARKCEVQEGSGAAGIAQQIQPAFMVSFCLTEDFDVITFDFALWAKDRDAETFTATSTFHKMSLIDLTTNSRKISLDPCMVGTRFRVVSR